jgi:hypothetical protein
MTLQQQQNVSGSLGSLDGEGAGDHDQPHRFESRPRTSEPYPPRPAQRGFNIRQYARLLIFRTQLQDYRAGEVQVDSTNALAAAA